MSDQDTQIGPDDAIDCSSAVGPQSSDDESNGSSAAHAKADAAVMAWCQLFQVLRRNGSLQDKDIDDALSSLYDCIDELEKLLKVVDDL